MKKVLLLVILWLFFGLTALPARGFEYPLITNPSLFPNSRVNDPQENLIKNPWFVDTIAPVNLCKSSFSPLDPLDPWKTDDPNDPDDAPWGPSDKPQDPHYTNCFGDWTGYAARFARNSGQGENEFYDNKDAKLWQVVGLSPTINPNNKTLLFHALIVAHRVNTYKVEIYGCTSASCPPGSGVLVWTPFNVSCTHTSDCVNATYGDDYAGVGCNPHPDIDIGRNCLWEDVAADLPASADNSTKLGLVPLQKTIPQGFPYYRIQFLMNYPTHTASSTGDVGGKLARVYFAVPGTGPIGSLQPSPLQSALPSSSPGQTLKQLILNWFTSLLDQNQDGEVNSLDFGKWIQNSPESSSNPSPRG